MGNLTKNTITRGAVVALALSAGAATTANAAVTRVAGADRISTAKEIFNIWPTTPTIDTIVVAAATGHEVDALTVAPLAKAKNAPIVLVDASNPVASITGQYTPAQIAAIKTVYIANGVGVISSDVETALKAMGKTVIRLGGSSRTDTALKIAKVIGASKGIVVANGDDSHLVDTLSIASIAAAKGMPIFLTSGGSLSADEAAYAKGLGATNVYALGGNTVVTDAAVAGLGPVTRLGGSSRYETNALVLNNFKADLDLEMIFVASGKDANLIDALAGAPLAGLVDAPIVFADDSISSDASTFLTAAITDKTEIAILGGAGAVSNSVQAQLTAIQAAKVTTPVVPVVPVVTTSVTKVAFTAINTSNLKLSLSAQAVVGTKSTVSVVATGADSKPVPGAQITFEVTTPLQSQNAQYKVTVTADANGVATLTAADGKSVYTRNAGDADTIVAYSPDSAVRSDIAKIYWGVKPILEVKADTTTPISGAPVTYTATLKNPVTGEPMVGRNLRVIFKENISNGVIHEGTYATASSYSNGVYQTGVRLFQDVNTQSSTLQITTNADGIAQFTVTGNHESVTPIVFYDNQNFYTGTLYDSSQYLASFVGNGNSKFDARELNVEAPKVTFTNSAYKITSDITADSFCSSTNYGTGKRYVITVNKADGTVYAGGTINVGINELLNGYDTRARIIATAAGSVTDGSLKANTFSAGTLVEGVFTSNGSTSTVIAPTVTDGYRVTKTAIKLDSNGKATIIIASDRVDTTATPVIWVDGDTPQMYSGQTNGQYDSTLDSIQKLNAVTFVNSFITNGTLTVDSAQVAKDVYASFKYNLYDQSGTSLAVNKARMTYVVYNSGSADIRVSTDVFKTSTNPNIVVDLQDTAAGTDVIIKPNQTRTISGNVNAVNPTLLVDSYYDDAAAAVKVSAFAIVYADSTVSPVRTSDIYTTLTSATATFNGTMWTQTTIIPGTFVGKATYAIGDAANLNNGMLRLDIAGNRFILADLSNVTVTAAYAGLVTSNVLNTATVTTLTTNDFTQATLLSDDISGLTVKKKIAAALGAGVAVKITFGETIDTVTGQYKIVGITILYASTDEARTINNSAYANAYYTATPAPVLTGDDTLNTIPGLTSAMEYRIGTATAYTDGSVTPDLTGSKLVYVRVKATSVKSASAETTLTFTTNPVVPPVVVPPVVVTEFIITKTSKVTLMGIKYTLTVVDATKIKSITVNGTIAPSDSVTIVGNTVAINASEPTDKVIITTTDNTVITVN